MAGIYDFKAKELEVDLAKFGLKNTWLRILVTHLSDKSQFDYILKNPLFKGIEKRKSNLIADLSIGDVSVLYEYSVAFADSESRKLNGQFFTPDDVAIYMAEQSKAFGDGVWLDPCSGVGNLSWHLAAIQENPEDFLRNYLIISDRDELALLIARTLFTLSFQKKRNRLFDEIEKNFVALDFLSVADSGSLELFDTNSQLSKIPIHDFVIVNPPYLATDIDVRFETSKAGDLYAYFLENIIKTSRGFISITPQSFTNAGKFRSLRKLLLDNYQDLTIFTFDNVPSNIFKGIKFGSKNSNQANSIRASIIIAREGMGRRRITSLIRWRSSERESLFKSLNKFLSDVPLSDSYFPKVSKKYKKLYMSVKDCGTLGELCSSKTTKYSLHIPSAPRYFIPALKKPVQRASQKTLFFRSAADRDYAYMLINSSYMYWWWRVRDGGMTLSLETITSLPLLEFDVDSEIVAALEKSEKINKVYKQNAGAAQENVKHPKGLMIRVNQAVIADYADLLITLHDNSELSN